MSRRRMAALDHVGLEVVAGVRAVERLVAEREVGHDVALDGGLQQRPVEPRRIAQVTTLDAPGADAYIREDVSAESLDHRGALEARGRHIGGRQAHRSRRERTERGAEPRDAALDFADPYPHARIDVAFLAHHHFHGRRVVWGRSEERRVGKESRAREWKE